MKKTILILLTILLFVSCDDDTDLDNETDIDLVTGIVTRDAIGGIIEEFGNPNTLTNDRLFCYPNPAIDILRIVDTSTNPTMNEAWIIKGNAKKIFQNTNFESIINSNLYTITELDNLELVTYDLSSSINEVTVDISSLEPGYYRIFVKFDNGEIIWENIYNTNEHYLTTIS